MIDFETLKKEYDEKGVIVIPNVFTAEECDLIKKNAYSLNDRDITKNGYPHTPSEKKDGKRLLVFFPSIANDYLNKIRTDERLVNLVKNFIGDDVKQINNQIYFRESGDKDQFAWHQDVMFRESRNFNNDVEGDYFQTIIAIDDITEDNGAIEFIEGSHKTMRIPSPENLRVFKRDGLVGKKYTANKGDVLIWSVMSVHGSEQNESKKDRMTYMNGFCRSKSTKTYPDYLVNGKVINEIQINKIP
jgi:ectoine hydroxylase-related dioxygenase (phytanoyl-CoA dioxygenase family)